ncbi:MAG: hypothetical protein D6679_12365 [Candidatus Hydrogenedentota bacterium]|nr:MAG: hypothetical protein D6679_12365 [Candidatus Hydrogenedentota bacterium]
MGGEGCGATTAAEYLRDKYALKILSPDDLLKNDLDRQRWRYVVDKVSRRDELESARAARAALWLIRRGGVPEPEWFSEIRIILENRGTKKEFLRRIDEKLWGCC